MDLSDRMKEYEIVPRNSLMRRTPVILRIDGRAFHTFTKSCKKPFDDDLANAMKKTTVKLMKEVQNCVFAYTQSDEISLLLVDYKEINTDAWFANDLQKMVSISASVATGVFNSEYKHPRGALAVFDSRAFNIPKEEANNYFIWRQSDCKRNSISQTARAYYSHKALHGKKSGEMLEMLRDTNRPYEHIHQGYRQGWILTPEMKGECQASPLFVENRDLINNMVNIDKIDEERKEIIVEKVEVMEIPDDMQKKAQQIFDMFPPGL